MNISILGTGVVGQTIGAKLAELGHSVVIGTRDPQETMNRADPGMYNMPPFRTWLEQHPSVQLGTFEDSTHHGEVVINATNGKGSLDALRQAGEVNLKGKVLIDISNPLDFSRGMPPSLWVSNTDSLAEMIQREFPEAKVVKTLNTVTASLMVNPSQLAGGEHTIFVSGDDAAAKSRVVEWLRTWFGWKHIIDLGGIATARSVEMYPPLWLNLYNSCGTSIINVKVVS